MNNKSVTPVQSGERMFHFSLLFFALVTGALWPCVLSEFVVQPPNIREQDLRLGYRPTSPCRGPGFLCQKNSGGTLNASAVLRIRTWWQPHTPCSLLLFLYSSTVTKASAAVVNTQAKFIKVFLKARTNETAGMPSKAIKHMVQWQDMRHCLPARVINSFFYSESFFFFVYLWKQSSWVFELLWQCQHWESKERNGIV